MCFGIPEPVFVPFHCVSDFPSTFASRRASLQVLVLELEISFTWHCLYMLSCYLKVRSIWCLSRNADLLVSRPMCSPEGLSCTLGGAQRDRGDFYGVGSSCAGLMKRCCDLPWKLEGDPEQERLGCWTFLQQVPFPRRYWNPALSFCNSRWDVRNACGQARVAPKTVWLCCPSRPPTWPCPFAD